MQQLKPPIAAKPKIKPKTNYVYAGKAMLESENRENSIDKNNFENGICSALEQKNQTKLNNCSQSFNGSCDKTHDAVEKNEQSFQNDSMRSSKVQEMKSKLFAKHQSQLIKQNQDCLSSVTNRSHQKKSSKELEKILGMRNDQQLNLKNEKIMKAKSFESESSLCEVSVGKVTSQMQQKLAEEFHSKIGKNIIEHVSVQQRYEDYKVKSDKDV